MEWTGPATSDAAAQAEASRRPDADLHVNWPAIRVLAVDDSEHILHYFKALAETTGFACDVTSGGEEALALIEAAASPCHIIFVDWIMPGMDGAEVARRIRATCGDSTLVVMISGAEWANVAREATEAGVMRFLPRPLFNADITRCIAMTANVFREDIERRLQSGMNGHLGRPIDTGEMTRKLTQCLQ